MQAEKVYIAPLNSLPPFHLKRFDNYLPCHVLLTWSKQVSSKLKILIENNSVTSAVYDLVMGLMQLVCKTDLNVEICAAGISSVFSNIT